jgi:hypothetical protein
MLLLQFQLEQDFLVQGQQDFQDLEYLELLQLDLLML